MDEGRRKLLLVTVYAGGAAIAAAVGAPLAAAGLTPLGRRTVRDADGFIDVAALSELREGEPFQVTILADRFDAWVKHRKVEVGAAWLLLRGSEVTAFSTVCPHLGCAVDRAPTGDGFFCACHKSAFGADGARLSGPAKRALDRLPTRLEAGRVLVRLDEQRPA